MRSLRTTGGRRLINRAVRGTKSQKIAKGLTRSMVCLRRCQNVIKEYNLVRISSIPQPKKSLLCMCCVIIKSH
jgi:hypothetical protein